MSNEPAKSLYRKFGFAPAGVRKNYYPEVNEDALVMWAHDTDSDDVRTPPGRHRGRAALAPASSTADRGATEADMLVLGIETSCDETAAAVVERVDGRYRILSSVVTSQIDLHARFGGVVPEIASRAHLELLPAAVSQALEGAGLDGTPGSTPWPPRSVPGSSGRCSSASPPPRRWPSAGTAPSSASTTSRPTSSPPGSRPVPTRPRPSRPSWCCSSRAATRCSIDMAGPGRYRLLGQTLDDAAGEAFDKVARYLGLGYPGGPVVDRLARQGDPAAIAFPRALSGEGPHELDFSFSGLKTSVVNHVRRHPEVADADVCASFQEAVVDVAVAKARRAADRMRRPRPLPGRRGGRQQPAAPALAGGVRRRRPDRPPAEPRLLHGQRGHDRGGRGVAARGGRADATRCRRRAEPHARPESRRPAVPGLPTDSGAAYR